MTQLHSENHMQFEIPAGAVKLKSDVCIVCCYDPKTKEKRECRSRGDLVNKGRHQYWYYQIDKTN